MKQIDDVWSNIQRFQSFVIKRMVPQTSIARGSLIYWRANVLFAILFTALLLCTLALVAAIALVMREQTWSLMIFDTLAYIVCLFLLLSSSLSFEIRSSVALLMCYIVGLGVIIIIGPLSGGPIWLFAFAVLVGVLLGLKAAIVAVALNSVTLVVIGWLIHTGRFGQAFPFFNTLEAMVAAGLNFIVLNVVVSMSVAMLVKGLVLVHEKEKRLSGRLEEEKEQLIQAKRDLELEIDERKQTEKALKDSEEKYRELSNSLPQIVFETDELGNLLFVNRNAFDLFGYTEADFDKGLNALQMLAPEDHPRALQNIQRVLAGETIGDREYMAITKKRSIFPIAIHVERVVHEGRPSGLRGIIIDLTEQKVAQEALKNSEEKLRNIVENSTNLFYSHTPDHELTYLSPQSREFLQCVPEEAMIRWDEFITDNPINENGFALTERAIKTGEKQPAYKLEIIGKVGRKMWVEVNEIPVVQNGKTIAIVGSLTDITERKRAEEELKKSHQTFLTVLDGIDATIYVADMETHEILFMNKHMIEAFGTNLTGRICFEVFRGESVPCAHCTNAQLLDEDNNPTGVCVWETKNPITGKWYMNYDRAIWWIDGRMARLQIATDISKLKEMEQERIRTEAQLQQAQKMEAIGTLAGGVAHDFNNLLMGIQGRTSLMLIDKDVSNPDFEHLRGIEEGIRSATELTKQLLGFARGGKYEIKATNLNETVNKSADLFGRTKKEITIHKKFTETLWTVEVDQGQLDQVLLNLYVNAWQAMSGAGHLYLETANITLDDAFVKPHGAQSGRYVMVSVTDTGIGMDEQTRQRVFDPFFTTKEMSRGTGLGLASAYGIVKSHGGIITVQSEKGKGATFRIYLPASEKAVREEVVLPAKILKGSETVLLIDDEEIIIEIGRELLETLGYSVFSARSGEAGIDIYIKNPDGIDLVILDMVMPGLGGSETYDKLKMIDPDIKTLLSSGYSIDGLAKTILDKGCDGFIQKPFTLSDLSQKVREIIDKE